MTNVQVRMLAAVGALFAGIYAASTDDLDVNVGIVIIVVSADELSRQAFNISGYASNRSSNLSLTTNILSNENGAARDDYHDPDVDIEIVGAGGVYPCKQARHCSKHSRLHVGQVSNLLTDFERCIEIVA